ncbi:hypothetical protein TNCV_5108581 [Trichonephila clavipes]|nr:hypothetical protein TNCV_5108581 [Trichonephila clavipes]
MQRLPGATFQQDNARPHTAWVSKYCLHTVITLPWPARFPDLSPIQLWNLGGQTGKILRPNSVALKSKNQEINRLQLAVKLPWAIFFESVDILS